MAVYVAIGWLLVILGGCLVLPTCISFFFAEPAAKSFAFSAFLSLLIGVCLVVFFTNRQSLHNQIREGHQVRGRFVLTIMAWAIISIFSALPFYLADVAHSFTDALFEAISSLTTTGFSLLQEKHYFYQGLRFWRIFLQWFGGFGIILMAVTLLPAFKVGGTQLIASEFSDHSEKIMPRASQISTYLMCLYVGMTVLGALLLNLQLPIADAFYYSIAAISTGGIIISKYTLPLLSSYCKIILMLCMIFGGSTLLLIVAVFQGDKKAYFKDDQIKGYYKFLAVTCFLTLLWLGSQEYIVNSLFIAISAVTTTGFALYAPYDGYLSTLFLLASFVGGCSGSTAGGIKVFRLQILYRIAKNQTLHILKPYSFFLTLYNQKPVEESTITSLIMVIFFYIIGWMFFTLGLASLGYSLTDSFPLAASVITNSGLYLGSLVHNLDELTDGAKWLMMGGMLCGRFEFVTLLAVILMPFSRR